jgi:hypothetical protein
MTDDPRIEKVARALCIHAGEDPNVMVTNAGGLHMIDRNTETYPRWHDHRGEAHKFVVMHDALNS